MGNITQKMVRKIIISPDAVNKAIPQRTIHSLKMEVCGTFGITPEDIEGNSKQKTVTLARKIFAARAATEAAASLSEIGKALGGRDHTVIMYYLRSFPIGKEAQPKAAETPKKK